MVGSSIFQKIGRFFSELGGAEAVYTKNLRTGNAGTNMPVGEFKAVPDDEMESQKKPMYDFKAMRVKQFIARFGCCIVIIVFTIVFLFLP
jgi:hypothetical protein